MTDFYVTLPSNVSNSAFNNTTSRYVTRLPEVLQLRRDEWSVALTDLVYPYSFVNVGKTLHYWIHFKNQPPVRISFPSAQYLDLEHIINTLNKKPQIRLKRAAVEELFEAKKKRGISMEEAQNVVNLLNLAQEEKKKKEEEASTLAGLMTAGSVVVNTIVEEEKKKDEEANALAGLVTTGAIVMNTVVEEEKKKEDQKKKKKDEEANALAALITTGTIVVNTVVDEEKKKEEHRKKKEEEANAIASLMTAGSVVVNTVIREEEEEEQKKEEDRRTQETLRKVEQKKKEEEEERRKEEEDRRKAERKVEARRKEEERAKQQNLIEELSRFRDGGLSKYKELAEAVLNKPKDSGTYKDLLVEFEKARSLVAIDDTNYDTSSLFHFEQEAGKLKVVFNEPEILFLEFEKGCSYFLGFDDTIVRSSMVAPHNADMFGDVSVIYLYSDLVDPIIVGNKKSNLLSVVPCTGQYGSIVYYTVPAPRYIPLLNSNIDSIRIELLTGSGDPVPFSWGTTVAVLHFKKIK